MTPSDPIVTALVERLSPALREAYEERAGIMEFDAERPRALAESLALLDLLRAQPGALLGLTALHVEVQRAHRVVLTTDPEFARQHLSSLDVKVLNTVDPFRVIDSRFSSLALLTRIG